MNFAYDCTSILPILKLIRKGVLPTIYVVLVVVVIVLITIDLLKAAAANKEDEIKAAQKMAIKRLVYGVAVFLVVFIVQGVFGLLSTTEDADVSQNWFVCWDQAK